MARAPLLFCLLLAGCTTLHYYGQAARGHLQLNRAKQDIDSLVADPDTPPQLRQRLERVKEMRRFAIRELKLPDSGSYTSYADLHRDVTLWMLTAAPELSLEAKTWCYPFVGCLAYRGYFRRGPAEAQARRLAARGYDTAIHPGLAYSTLGLSKDPVLNTMLGYDDIRLAGVLFHELAHELLYVRGDTLFNESFATAVEKLGRERWARRSGMAWDAAGFARDATLEKSFNRLLLETREELRELFSSPLEDALKRRRKAEIYARLRQRYRHWKACRGGIDDYDHWFLGDGPNNARLALLATYELAVPAFLALFSRQEESFPRFYDAVRELSRLSADQRKRRLEDLMAPPTSGQ